MGVDNLFILVNTSQKIQLRAASRSLPDHIARTLAMVAPSMFLSTATQATSFLLGALSDMPAVKAFSLYAALALIINFILQVRREELAVYMVNTGFPTGWLELKSCHRYFLERFMTAARSCSCIC